jgi:Tol biopolymer transport system component
LFIESLPWALPASELSRYFVVGGRPWRVSADSTISRYELKSESQSESGCGTTVFSISPDMRQAAFGRNRDLFLLDVENGFEQQISHFGREWDTTFAAIDVRFTSWSADSKSILFCVTPEYPFTDSDAESRVRRFSYGFYKYDVPAKSVSKVSRMMEFKALLPDGRMIGAGAGKASKAPELRWVRAGKLGPLVIRDLPGVSQVFVSADGKWLLASVTSESTSQIVAIDLNRGKAEAVSPKGRFAEYQSPSFSPSGKHRAYVQQGPVHSGQPATDLVIDGAKKFACGKPVNYAWIDEHRIGLLCEPNVYVLDTASGTILGQHAFD